MRILGVETSTFTGSVACVADGVLVAESTLDVRQTHTAVLLPTIDRTLHDAQWSIDDVDAIGVSLGPGSFTSLRIGLATVKGLAAKRDIPVAGVGTLHAMAVDVAMPDAPIMPVIDARRGEYYAAAYRWTAGVLTELMPPAVGPIAELFAGVTEPVWCRGDVDEALRARIADACGQPVMVPQPRLAGARGSAVAVLAAEAIAAGVNPAAALTPLYLRDHLGRKPVA